MAPSRSKLVLSAMLALGKVASSQPTTGWEEWSSTCPPPSTTSLSFTQYDTVYSTESFTTSLWETATQKITVVQTVTQYVTMTTPTTVIQPTTDILVETATETEDFYQTDTTTDWETQTQTIVQTQIQTQTQTTVQTETQTTVSPTTVTASELLEVFTYTSEVTSLTICPTRLVNPTFTALAPYPTDWTWGCPPGWLCKPKQNDCNFEAGTPDRNFYCAPNECVPSTGLPEPLPEWNSDPSGNLSIANDPSLKVAAIDSYFNMNPEQFGLTYDIFVVGEVFTVTSTIIIPPQATQATVKARQFQQQIPGACYTWCNNCLLEAQSVGKTSALCLPGSSYEVDLQDCVNCIGLHQTEAENAGSFVNIAPQFQQYMDYCSQTTVEVSTSITVTSTLPGGTSTSVIPVSSVTLVSKVSTTPTPSPSSTPLSSVVASSAASSVASTTPSASSTSAPPLTMVSPVSVPTTTTAILPTTWTSAQGASTLSGTMLSSLTIVMPMGNSSTTLAGSQLSGATVVLPGSTTVTSTGSYTTVATLAGSTAVSIGGTPQASATNPSLPSSSTSAASTFTGAATSNLRTEDKSILLTILAALIALI